MSDYKMFNFTPQVVNNKTKYREEEERRNKLTYNFITDSRLKRGHNFGVVYVTNLPSEDKEEIKPKKKSEVNAKILNAELEKNEIYKKIDNFDNKRSNLGVNTDPVTSTVRPKPLTFEIDTQTGEYLDTPQIPLFWPVQTGLEVGTQIEDGDLFDFDEEVEPLLNVLMSKILEQSRMEVLEEEEIRKMKEHQREFERLRNRELEEVQTLEKKELRINEEKERRVKEQRQKKINAIIHQKRLFCRSIVKEYLKNLKVNTIKHLIERKVFKNPLEDLYYTRLLPAIHHIAEETHSEDFVVVNKLNKTFTNNFIQKKKNLHRDALNKEKERKNELERRRLEEIARKEEEKRRRKEEEIKRKKQIEIQALKALINEELIKHAEYSEDPTVIYDINAYYQKDTKFSPLTGGYYAQFAIIISYLNKLHEDLINEEKLHKILELFIPKLPHFYILYTLENLEEYKKIIPSLNEIEEIAKLDEHSYSIIAERISQDLLKNDDILIKIFDEIHKLGYEDIENSYHKVLSTIMRMLKLPEFSDRIKFLQKDTTIDSNYTAVCELFTESVHKIKIPDLYASVPMGAGKKSVFKKLNVVQAKTTFEPEFYEKTVILPTFSEKIKILAINHSFERMLRHNIFECINKISKIEGDKEVLKQEFEEFYTSQFLDKFISNLASGISKERLEFNISPPVVNEPGQ